MQVKKNEEHLHIFWPKRICICLLLYILTYKCPNILNSKDNAILMINQKEEIVAFNSNYWTSDANALVRPVQTIQFLEPIVFEFKEFSDANQHFFKLKQCQKSNWILKMDHVNQTVRS